MKKILFFALLLTQQLFSLEYKVAFEGINDKKMLQKIEENSSTLSLKDKKKVETYSQLRKRAENDAKKLKKVADAFGYYGSEVEISIVRGKIPTAIFRFDLGFQYTVKSVITSCPLPSDDSKLHIVGKTASFDAIIQTEEHVLGIFKNHGYAFAKIQKHEVIANKKEKNVIIRFLIDPGPHAAFGKVKIYGNHSVDEHALQIHIPWKEGEIYNKDKVDLATQSLEATGLFSSVVFSVQPKDLDGPFLPIDLYVIEAKHKSIATGISYNSYKGPGVLLSWEHRNLFGNGNKFTATSELWKKEQDVKLFLKKPHFQRYDQDGFLGAEFSRKDILPYFSESTALTSTIERHINKKWEAFYGIKGEYLRSISDEGHDVFHLAKLPLGIKWTNVDAPLDPTKGMIVSVKFTPCYQTYQKQFSYGIHQTTASCYKSIFNKRVTGAVKVVYGNIVGASQFTIPKPDRFFSGSENTLRGYKYYSVSPLDDKHRPIGGRSLAALSLEARFRFDSPFGCVLFYDMGNVYSTNIPTFKDFLYSVGVGFRYTTPIGPLRFDIAVPLERRKHVDSFFQIYCSIGQSF